MDQFKAARTGNLNWFCEKKATDTLPDLTLYLSRENRVISSSETTDGMQSVPGLAAANGHLEIVKWLTLENKQEPTATALNNSALSWAANNGHFEIVKWLVTELDQKIEINALKSHAVCNAFLNKHFEIVKYLIKKDSKNPTLVSRDTQLLDWSVTAEFRGLTTWLINDSWKYGQEPVSETDARTALHQIQKTLEADCPDYVALQLLQQLGYSIEDASKEVQETLSRKKVPSTRKI